MRFILLDAFSGDTQMETTPSTVERKFESALASFVSKAREDRHILAAILFGSLSADRVWEKSDIDLIVVTRDDKNLFRRESRDDDEVSEGAALLENDVYIHVFMQPRSAFRKMIEGGLQSSFMHSALARSRLLFTHDETIRELYDGIQALHSRDRQVQLMHAASHVIPTLYKAEKWFHVRRDLHYAFLYIMLCANSLAKIEVFMHGQLAGREVIQQALELNPEFFNKVYTDLIDQPKTEAVVGEALGLIDAYLEERLPDLFQPILDYLAEEGSARSVTEIETWFDNQMNLRGVTTVCEWLSDKDVISRVSSPLRLTLKSNVEYEELGFYYYRG